MSNDSLKSADARTLALPFPLRVFRRGRKHAHDVPAPVPAPVDGGRQLALTWEGYDPRQLVLTLDGRTR